MVVPWRCARAAAAYPHKIRIVIIAVRWSNKRGRVGFDVDLFLALSLSLSLKLHNVFYNMRLSASQR